MEAVSKLIGVLRGSLHELPQDKRAEAEAEIADLEIEINSPVEKSNRARKITDSLKSLSSIVTGAATAGKAVLEMANILGVGPQS
jgi:hypothetical protein